MNRTTLIVLNIALLSGFTLIACGGSDDADDSGTTSSGTKTDEDSEGASGAEGAPQLSCDASGDGVCENDTDCPLILDGTASSAAESCGFQCFGAEEGCVSDCMVEQGMTQGCGDCQELLVTCVGESCFASCAADGNSEACLTCVEENCGPDYRDCSGLE